MGKRKLPYKEGDWYAVPLQTGGYCLGVVARADGRGRVLGYFFGPPRTQVPTQEDTQGLWADDAKLIAMFGDLGLLRGEWPIVGPSADWERGCWPVPAFARTNLMGQSCRVVYDDGLQRVGETPARPEALRGLPEDAACGYVSIQIQLTRLLPPGEGGASSIEVGKEPRESPKDADLFDDDVAADARGVFEQALDAGLSPGQAADQVTREMAWAAEDEDDAPVLTLALASLLLDHGVGDHPVVRQAREVIATGAGLERWREAGAEALSARQRLYDRIAARLR